jgi:hypothetical protein
MALQAAQRFAAWAWCSGEPCDSTCGAQFTLASASATGAATITTWPTQASRATRRKTWRTTARSERDEREGWNIAAQSSRMLRAEQRAGRR